MGEERDHWNLEARTKDLHLSPSCSSFEVLDPHDPTISRLATQLFRRTNDYLQGEMAAGQNVCCLLKDFSSVNNMELLNYLKPQEHYILLEEINRMAITKYTDLRNLAANLSKTLNEYNDLYQVLIKPLLLQIDRLDAQVSQFETNAYRLDSYTKQLRARFKELEEFK